MQDKDKQTRSLLRGLDYKIIINNLNNSLETMIILWMKMRI